MSAPTKATTALMVVATFLRIGPAPHARQRAVEHGERGQGDEAQPLQNVVDLVVELQFHFLVVLSFDLDVGEQGKLCRPRGEPRDGQAVRHNFVVGGEYETQNAVPRQVKNRRPYVLVALAHGLEFFPRGLIEVDAQKRHADHAHAREDGFGPIHQLTTSHSSISDLMRSIKLLPLRAL